MTRFKGLLTLAALVASVALGNCTEAASIHDRAGLFQPDVLRKAQAQLDRVEHATGIPIVIETIDGIPGLGKDASKTERETEINREAVKRDREIHDEGVYILISKRDRVISNVLIRERYAALLPAEARHSIREAFVAEFRKNQNYDGGLTAGVREIEQSLSAVRAPVRARGNVVRHGAPAQSSMMGTFFLIIAGILGVLIVVRIIGGLMGRGAGAGYPPMRGGMGPGGMGPGGPGYGGGMGGGGMGGGGFFSGMLGGLGGALAGNWLYDQFSGRHGQTTTSEAYSSDVANPDPGGDAIVGGDDNGGQGESWDNGGTPDAGGGDWGGGGDSGGGDWGGGGGGDWGGGGGGGGDW